ncbi:(R)-specific enoyl-CoA hydratase [Paraburkholderia domus]|jgi:Acyl dehydratase|uniref:(R)-specific enoyl-CoA hydratase n=1 Tax=Paraburkholderia domus TaxID=2793075 RepID=A0A9N8R0E2_9BURK|nr:MaoC family dehydratase [Paraburkholderia domus]MBK5049031.1 MaoC family dehydratase [Burkholderia sp. R-70006]MBK5061258.1 MaoC family dehydratase [Burkholderia sp. R-70199]MBK5086301.1 MaoC family dehydratase [Burkholderia sp. R-69927]MBK5120419.1 MaoC family dehydratase [Burkholderia sp. R-69980]MBK5165862.1 MaoC family dehydratase [Burkholderia sp. R-70211]MBK5179867.1 MaoC family dehydratase [Burkholderia sp. R-69749]MCI0147174.1 MaoC family dehydratase N-terminal domain-containing p
MNEIGGYDIEDLEAGMSATFAKTITETDILFFAAASGDNNAVHINEEFARTTPFKGRIAHGMLTAGVISATLAGHLPGPGTVYLGQNLRFKAPVRPGDTVHATVAVKELQPEKSRVVMSTVCTVGGKVVIDGEAVVMATSRARRLAERVASAELSAIMSQSSEAS